MHSLKKFWTSYKEASIQVWALYDRAQRNLPLRLF
jgi:hypothetical protein